MSGIALRESMWPSSVVGYDITLPSPVENLALDDVLLSAVDQDHSATCLRLWESQDYFVVLGRSNRASAEVDIDRCREEGIPILRRSSGGGAVIIGPGCLCYTLVMPLAEQLRSLGVSKVTQLLMSRNANGFKHHWSQIEVDGTSDLVAEEQKFSGNAQRWLRNAFIHHGTLLYEFDLSYIERFLRHPTREPDYRRARRHSDFVANLRSDAKKLKDTLCQVWNVTMTECPSPYLQDARHLASERYVSDDWRITP